MEEVVESDDSESDDEELEEELEEDAESDQSAACKLADDDATIGGSTGEVSIGSDSMGVMTIGSGGDSNCFRAASITVELDV